jgi:phosphatidylglycerophosphatase A
VTAEARPAATSADRFARAVTSACGAGFLPVAPGTWGSAVTTAALFAVFAARPSLLAGPLAAAALVARALALGWLGVWAGDRVSAMLGDDDPSEVVIDEVVGQLLTYALLPVAGRAWTLTSFSVALVVGFLLFRALDILKPGPIDALQSYHGGLGIMADDFAAGVVGACVMLAGASLL